MLSIGTTEILRPTWAEIDLSAIADNVRQIRRMIGPRTMIMAVLKADAYGHGAVPIAKVALENGADWLGVAIVEEGVELRRANIKAPILILGLTSPGEVSALLSSNLTPTVCNLDNVALISAEAERHGRIANIHIKIDTGMGRIGLLPEEAPDFIRRVSELKNVRIEGLCTHLSSAEEEGRGFTKGQMNDFRTLIGRLAQMGIAIPLKHAANSAGLLSYHDSHLDMVRPGLIIYGLYPSNGTTRTIDLRPAMSFKTSVSYLKRVKPGKAISYGRTFVADRETLVATLPVGYADGYSRSLSNRGEVLIRGRRAPIIGRVCMDMCLADVSGVPGAGLHDEVVLMGKQGDEEITADDLAAKLRTISYEVVCSIGKRVPRVYFRGGRHG